MYWRPDMPRSRSLLRGVLWLALAALACGCGHPMGADRVETRRVYEQLNESALTGSSLSSNTHTVLHRYNLTEAFEDDPDDTLARLHEIACNDSRHDIPFALAELNYARARALRKSFWRKRRRRARDHYLASCVYAWLFLCDDGTGQGACEFDRRSHMALDMYNRGLGQGLIAADARDGKLDLSSGTRQLPAGPVKVEFSMKSPSLDPEKEDFFPADQFLVRGLTVRSRTAGMGAPLIAVGSGERAGHRTRVMPATAFRYGSVDCSRPHRPLGGGHDGPHRIRAQRRFPLEPGLERVLLGQGTRQERPL